MSNNQVKSVKLLNAKVDVYTVADREFIVIRGTIDPDSIGDIQTPAYQRQVMIGKHQRGLVQALRTATVPDIEIGMRGSKYRVQAAENGSDTYFLQSEVFVIDGLQRLSAAKELMKSDAGARPMIGVVVITDSNEEWERKRFKDLNSRRLGLNGNVLLRNMRTESRGVDLVYGLSMNDQSFQLYRRIQWEQRMARTELVPALTFCRTIGVLHSRFCKGTRGKAADTAAILDRVVDTVSASILRENIRTFVTLLDECFSLTKITYGHAAVVTKSGFLTVLAEVLTRHDNFWRGQRLSVDKDLKAKIRMFAVNDPEVARLAGASGKAIHLLYLMLLEHINSGKRTRRLELNTQFTIKETDDSEVDVGEDEQPPSGK